MNMRGTAGGGIYPGIEMIDRYKVIARNEERKEKEKG